MNSVFRRWAVAMVLGLLFWGVVPAATVAADDAPSPFPMYPRALGIAGGQISGTGLAWMYWPGTLGVQLVGGATYVPAGEDSFLWPERTLDYNISAQLYRSVLTDTWAGWLSGQLYTWGSLRHRGYIPVVLEETTDDYVYREQGFVAALSGGVGIGVELLLFRHFSIPIEFGYIATGEFLGSEATPFTIDLAGQTGFRYRY